MKETHWETSAKWYDQLVGSDGHYYHEHVILPELKKLLGEGSTLDLACGQGVLCKVLNKKSSYLGVDGSKTLVQQAMKRRVSPSHRFEVHDLMKPFRAKEKFSQATCVLAMQNIEDPEALIQTAFDNLEEGGQFVIVLNHPCFRIPRQSSWGIDEKKQCQYRRLDCYMTPQKIPIQTHPGKKNSVQTLSFHFPLSHYFTLLAKAGFHITAMHEWCSDKKSEGKKARMENRSRNEFPLFLCLVSKKVG